MLLFIIISQKAMETVEFQQKTEIDELRRWYSDENPAITGKVPEGYMMGEEFVRTAKDHIAKYFKDNGLL